MLMLIQYWRKRERMRERNVTLTSCTWKLLRQMQTVSMKDDLTGIKHPSHPTLASGNSRFTTSKNWWLPCRMINILHLSHPTETHGYLLTFVHNRHPNPSATCYMTYIRFVSQPTKASGYPLTFNTKQASITPSQNSWQFYETQERVITSHQNS